MYCTYSLRYANYAVTITQMAAVYYVQLLFRTYEPLTTVGKSIAQPRS
jgi:hypothetical protein